jgi:phage major head subunit gpT-like protein
LLDFLKDKKIEISEDELDDMGVMVYSPKMREAGKDPTEISGSSSLQ